MLKLRLFMGRKESNAENEKVNDQDVISDVDDFHQGLVRFDTQISHHQVWFPLIIILPYLAEATVPFSLQ